MTRSLFLAYAIVLLVPAVTHAQTDQTIAELRIQLKRRPDDVDTRLRLATFLSWRGENDAAKSHVLRVVAQTPEYWDAHLLLARLEAWEGAYDEALARLRRVVPHLEDKRPATELHLNILLWSKRADEAMAVVGSMLDKEESADLYYRLAMARRQKLHYLRGYLAARKALSLNPLHERATALKKQTRLVGVNTSYQFEIYPNIPVGEGRYAHGVVVAGTAMPRNWLSITLINEYRHRFGNHNNRVTLQGDWRLTKKLQLTTRTAFAVPSQALSKANGALELTFPIIWKLLGRGSYLFDLPVWGGHLHRFQGFVEGYLPYGFRANLRYTVGLLGRCGTADALQGVDARVLWSYRGFQVSSAYGFGMELDQPVPNGRPGYTQDGCPLSPDDEVLDLNSVRSHNFGFQVSYTFHPKLVLGGGYTYSLRFNDTEVHGSNLGVRTWF